MNLLILSCGTRKILVDYFMDRANGFDRVVGCDCSPLAPALYFTDAHYLAPRMDDPSYLDFVLDLCEKENIDVVLPLHEDELVLISAHRDLFASRGILPVISDAETIYLCRDKLRLAHFLTAHHIPTVPTLSSEEALSQADTLEYPVYLKPRDGAGSIGHLRAQDAAAMRTFLTADHSLLVQPCLSGKEYCGNLYVDLLSGEAVSAVFIEKIRMRAGETDKAVSVDRDDLFRIITEVAKCIPLRGPVDIDFIESDGVLYLLEINPRFGGAYPSAHVCGADFMRLIAKNARGETITPSFHDYETDVVSLRFVDIIVPGKVLT